MQNTSWGLPLVFVLILFFVVVEFLVPGYKRKRVAQQSKKPSASQMSL